MLILTERACAGQLHCVMTAGVFAMSINLALSAVYGMNLDNDEEEEMDQTYPVFVIVRPLTEIT